MQFIFIKEKMSFKTKYKPEECIELLKKETDQHNLKYYLTINVKGKPVIGSFYENRIRLEKRIYSRNSSSPVYYGELLQDAGGTRIEGYFGLNEMSPFVAILLIVVSIIAQLGTLAAKAPLTAHLFLLLFAVGVFFFPSIAYYLSSGQKDFLIEFVKNVLDSEVIK